MVEVTDKTDWLTVLRIRLRDCEIRKSQLERTIVDYRNMIDEEVERQKVKQIENEIINENLRRKQNNETLQIEHEA